MSNELVLTESKTLRAQYRMRVDALDRIGELAVLPDTAWSTTRQVADFYGVPQEAIKSLVHDNRAELVASGYAVLSGSLVSSLREPANLSPKVRSLAVFSRTAVLNVGMLLTESTVALALRRYLLSVEATATVEHRTTSLQLVRIQERQDYRNILESLKLGGAESEDYARVQNALYRGLFGQTATEIRRTQPQRTGEPRRRGDGLVKSSVAKDYLTEQQIVMLDNTVLAVVAQLRTYYPNGATAEQMVAVINRALALLRIGA